MPDLSSIFGTNPVWLTWKALDQDNRVWDLKEVRLDLQRRLFAAICLESALLDFLKIDSELAKTARRAFDDIDHILKHLQDLKSEEGVQELIEQLTWINIHLTEAFLALSRVMDEFSNLQLEVSMDVPTEG